MTTTTRPPVTPGPLLFARYAYPPNALGLCGADHPRELLEYGNAHASDLGLAELAQTFDGAWPYLTLIAGANGISDPLDPRVVEAYWVGNDLLAQVSGEELARHIDDRFRGRLGRAQDHINDTIGAGALPHHCFHVFAVYPWLGLLRTGIVDQPLHILDQCRITPGRVIAVGDTTMSVSARPLRWERGTLALGDPAPRTVSFQSAGLSFISEPKPGDWVSCHWDFVCDQLTPKSAGLLLAANQHAIRAVNHAGAAHGLS